MTVYSLIQEEDNWVLKEGYSLYTPYTSFYEINLKEIAEDEETAIKLLNKQVKQILIYSKIKGTIVNVKGIKQILKNNRSKPKLITQL